MKNTKVNIRSIFNQCILCNDTTDHPSKICHACIKDLPWLRNYCKICSLPLQSDSDDLTCKQCLSKPPSFSKTYSLFEYRFPINHLLSSVKYHRKPEYLGHILALYDANLPNMDHIDCIIPIPMHRLDLLHRGFNQALIIASAIAKIYQKPLDTKCLKKVVRSPKQAGLTKKERIRNLKGTFTCKTTPARRVLLVDDVMTTGTTVELAAKTLLNHGAEHVEVVVLARTPDT